MTQCFSQNRHRNYRTLKVSEYAKRLEHAGISNSYQEALWLMSHALGLEHYKIFARKDFSPEEISKIEAVISRRESGKPLQYILGNAEFYGRDFVVGEGVLIPRHDTETLIDAVKKYFAPDEKFCFLDWGTGSGCIAITILIEYRNSFAYIVENSSEALKYAAKNLSLYNLENRTLINENIINPCSFIISNPPYIPEREIKSLMKSVRDYEPESALNGGEDGMKFYRLIISQAMNILKPGGYIFFEVGNINQVNELKYINANNFIFENLLFDANNFPRCVVLKRRL